jgi:hypothetical protein
VNVTAVFVSTLDGEKPKLTDGHAGLLKFNGNPPVALNVRFCAGRVIVPLYNTPSVKFASLSIAFEIVVPLIAEFVVVMFVNVELVTLVSVKIESTIVESVAFERVSTEFVTVELSAVKFVSCEPVIKAPLMTVAQLSVESRTVES